MEKLEKPGELDLIKALREESVHAIHMDCTTDGFPDVVVFGRKIILIEMKAHRETEKIFSAMEPSQSVFIDAISRSGYKDTILCIYSGGLYTMYSTKGILRGSMAGRPISSLALAESKVGFCYREPSRLSAMFIKSIANGGEP